jgi:hypothetical protein
MHDIEPHFLWRNDYVASEDENSPFFGREYDEFRFTNKIYNYFIHPQWDYFGSSTLYAKLLYADYDDGFAILELIGEWNDCLHNDVMYLKREVADHLFEHHINKYIIICENVLNFHGDDDAYYEEWYDDIKEEDGWICLINTLDHVSEEMKDTRLQYYIHFGEQYNGINWRPQKPKNLFLAVNALVQGRVKRLPF